ncbi:MAG: hypothetical protein ACLP1X_33440 [Polyangiaceae bacterium]
MERDIRRTPRRFAGGLAAVAVLAACTAGSGSLVTYAPAGRDDPGTTRDVPPSTRDNPAGPCIVCDVNYDCSGPSSALGDGGIELSTSDGTCVQELIDVVCSGALFNASGCSGGGGGPFTCGDTTCSPGAPIVTVITSPASGGTTIPGTVQTETDADVVPEPDAGEGMLFN